MLPGVAVHPARNLGEVVADPGDGQGQGGDNLRVLRDAMARLEPWLRRLAKGRVPEPLLSESGFQGKGAALSPLG